MENLSNISVIKDICQKFGFSFSHSLGQNFLINPTVCPGSPKKAAPGRGWGCWRSAPGSGC